MVVMAAQQCDGSDATELRPPETNLPNPTPRDLTKL